MTGRTGAIGAGLVGWLLLALPLSAQGPKTDLDEAIEKAMKAAATKVAPSVVQIETTGGTEGVGPAGPGRVPKGIGPTTGLIVAPDGYIVSSAFNFANKPTAITVTIPGRKERLVARVVATDQTRMITLLKVDATGLPVPTAAPAKDLRVGQWALALGRTLDTVDRPPSISVGIISALGRIWGKAMQTDAKVSPINYGGPLVDIRGRVQGVLVPASPRSEGETAGVEWYDSGIGFAIPLDEINAVLPRLREGKNLVRGLLGITPQSADIHGVKPTIATVAPDSAAAKAGLKPGDVLTEIDGKPVANQAQVLHALGPRYAGDVVSLKYKRGDKEFSVEKLTLSALVSAYEFPFLGILPMRDDPELGVEIRFVYPKSPAEKAGLKEGDRILKIALATVPQLTAFSGRDEFMTLMSRLSPDTQVKLEVQRKAGGKTETLTVQLGHMPELTTPPGVEVPEKLPEKATHEKALAPRKKPGPVGPGPKPPPGPPMPPPKEKKEDEKKDDKKKVETGLIERKNALGREYWAYVPENYDPNVAHAVVIWLHATGKGKDAKDMVDLWQFICEDNHVILIGPKSNNATGWQAGEIDFVREAAKEVMDAYTVDRQRVVAHGMGTGGQMAFYLGFNARDLVRGVATTGAVLATAPKENLANQRLSFYVVGGGKDPIVKDIAESKPKLIERKFPVIYRQVEDMGREYLDRKTFDEMIRWIDALDRS